MLTIHKDELKSLEFKGQVYYLLIMSAVWPLFPSSGQLIRGEELSPPSVPTVDTLWVPVQFTQSTGLFAGFHAMLVLVFILDIQ